MINEVGKQRVAERFFNNYQHGAVRDVGVCELRYRVVAARKGVVFCAARPFGNVLDNGPVVCCAFRVCKFHRRVCADGQKSFDRVGREQVFVLAVVLIHRAEEAIELFFLSFFERVRLNAFCSAKRCVGVIRALAVPMVVGAEIQIFVAVGHQVVVTINGSDVFGHLRKDFCDVFALVGVVGYLRFYIVGERHAV